MLATITLAGTITAQGPVVDSHADGRVTIADGLLRLTGRPIGRALRATLSVLGIGLMALGAAPSKVQAETLLNVSYDPTRELYRELNEAFVAHWTAQGNPTPQIEVSHGGSGSQARAVIDGLEAQVVTLAGADIAVETEVTATRCGREVMGEMILSEGGKATTAELTLALPDCDEAGGFVVLNNPVGNMKLAATE